jgi:hypothetical protein
VAAVEDSQCGAGVCVHGAGHALPGSGSRQVMGRSSAVQVADVKAASPSEIVQHHGQGVHMALKPVNGASSQGTWRVRFRALQLRSALSEQGQAPRRPPAAPTHPRLPHAAGSRASSRSSECCSRLRVVSLMRSTGSPQPGTGTASGPQRRQGRWPGRLLLSPASWKGRCGSASTKGPAVADRKVEEIMSTDSPQPLPSACGVP